MLVFPKVSCKDGLSVMVGCVHSYALACINEISDDNVFNKRMATRCKGVGNKRFLVNQSINLVYL